MHTFLKTIAILFIVAVAIGISCGGTMLLWVTIEWIFTWFGWYSWLMSMILSMPVSWIIGLIVFYRVLRFAFFNKKDVTWKELLLSARFINAMKMVGIMLLLWILFILLISKIASYPNQQKVFEVSMLLSSVIFMFLSYYYLFKKK